jgi:hypothetical protein
MRINAKRKNKRKEGILYFLVVSIMTKYQTENIYFYLKESGKTKKKRSSFDGCFHLKKRLFLYKLYLFGTRPIVLSKKKVF